MFVDPGTRGQMSSSYMAMFEVSAGNAAMVCAQRNGLVGAVALEVPPLVRVGVGAVPDLHRAAVQVAVPDIEADRCPVSS